MDVATNTVSLAGALRDMAQHPLQLLRHWNWKAAAFSTLLHVVTFFLANRNGGHHAAMRAVVAELLWAPFAAGVAGSITQKLRHAEPERATAAIIWLAMPTALLAAQATVHRIAGTPHVRSSLIASFVFASFASGFNWFAMRRGAFVTGEHRSFARDLLLVPKLIAQFLFAPLQ